MSEWELLILSLESLPEKDGREFSRSLAEGVLSSSSVKVGTPWLFIELEWPSLCILLWPWLISLWLWLCEPSALHSYVLWLFWYTIDYLVSPTIFSASNYSNLLVFLSVSDGLPLSSSIGLLDKACAPTFRYLVTTSESLVSNVLRTSIGL